MKHSEKWSIALAVSVFLSAELASAVPIDPGVPLGGYPPATLPLPVYYEFRTSWDGIAWSEDQKNSARSAISYLGGFFVDQPAFTEQSTPDDFSLRWAGADLFKDWGMYGGNSWDYSTALAFAVKPRPDNSTPWSQALYPYNEIYFNSTYKWHFNPFTPPAEGDPANDIDGEFDFWSILLHETIHMLSVQGHAPHSDEVMYESISDGQRKWELKASDKQMLRQAGYNIPEPSSVLLVVAGVIALTVTTRMRSNRRAPMVA